MREYAPLVADILADPHALQERFDQPLYVCRSVADLSDAEKLKHKGPFRWVEATTEAFGLLDLDMRLDEAAGILQSDGERFGSALRTINALRTGLRFIGTAERSVSEQDTAVKWVQSVHSAPDSELHVVAPMCESESLMFQSIRARVARMDPGAAESLHPFDMRAFATGVTWERRKRNGVKLPDDWIMTASQMRKRIAHLTHNGLAPEEIDVNLICAPEDVKSLDGVAVSAMWKYPSLGRGSGRVSLVGSHSVPDFGAFDEVMRVKRAIEEHSRQGSGQPIEWRFPVILKPARPYKPSVQQLAQRGEPSQFDSFNQTVAAYKKAFPGLPNTDPAI